MEEISLLNCEDHFLSIEYLEDGSCTVSVNIEIEANGDWKFVKVGGSGTVTITSTQSTCAEAARDVKAGIVALVK